MKRMLVHFLIGMGLGAFLFVVFADHKPKTLVEVEIVAIKRNDFGGMTLLQFSDGHREWVGSMLGQPGDKFKYAK